MMISDSELDSLPQDRTHESGSVLEQGFPQPVPLLVLVVEDLVRSLQLVEDEFADELGHVLTPLL